MSQKIPAEIVLNEIKEKHHDIDVIGEYSSKGAPLRVRCKVCGHEWNSTANRLIFGCGCQKCAGVRKRNVPIKKKTHEQFIAELAQKSPNIILKTQYQNAHTNVNCECKICGHIWSARPSNLLTGFGCPMCGNKSCSDKQRKSHDEFVTELHAINPQIEVIGEYNGNTNNVKLRCMNCGNIWEAMPCNLLHGKYATGCPHCKMSHGELAIANILDRHEFVYTRWKSFDGLSGVKGRPLSYDFFIPSLNLLIEYQGEFHDHTARIQTDDGYQTQSEHDKRKREYAERNHIRLLEIWYYDNLEEKLENELNNITDPVTTIAS